MYARTPSIATDSSLLMTLLFVLRVMNLFWIAVLAAIVLLEKLSTHGLLAGRVMGLAAIAWRMHLIIGDE